MTANRRIVLASGSPRRRELLARLGVSFEVVVSGVDESTTTATAPELTVELAERKARAVAALRPEDLILGSDTVVEVDGRILGKPASPAEALAMLRSLRGRTHRVVTGVVVLDAASGTIRGRAAVTAVTMRDVPDAELAAYVATGEPMDAAGAYAIQGGAAAFVTTVDGALDTVIGLPTAVVRDLLTAAGTAVPAPAANRP
ncbi:MAF protein [Frankia torreyi]|uniref:dTTP/UTP pyrophosphatase n=1 Tax=Frankia torreyi TaxID=1856 RepID=A0A0D8BCF1_9ACTN|nr:MULTISPECIES: Maf family protein [Frankia]KJE21851.1 MAF protein [Frankia torreyi]KQM03992.1 MAF protein [Frankia sp. CpI1-P]